MKTTTIAPDSKGDRFPPELISHAVWFSFRFRDVEELSMQRGIVVSSETVRQWCVTCGQTYAHERRRYRQSTGVTWHLDKIFLTSRGRSFPVEGDEDDPTGEHQKREGRSIRT